MKLNRVNVAFLAVICCIVVSAKQLSDDDELARQKRDAVGGLQTSSAVLDAAAMVLYSVPKIGTILAVVAQVASLICKLLAFIFGNLQADIDAYKKAIDEFRQSVVKVTKNTQEQAELLKTLSDENVHYALKIVAMRVKAEQLDINSTANSQGKRIEGLTEIWSNISKMSDEEFEKMRKEEGLMNLTLQEIKTSNLKYMQDIKTDLKNFGDNNVEGMVSDVKKNVKEYMQISAKMGKRTDDITDRLRNLTEMRVGLVAQINVVQSKEIERLGKIADSAVVNIKRNFEEMLNYTKDKQQAEANNLLTLARELRGELTRSLRNISSRMSSVADEQMRIELVMRYSKLVNRIDYLRDWFQDISADNSSEYQSRANDWARAVIYGDPSDHPIEEIIADLDGSTSDGDFEVLGNKGLSLLDIYHGNIKEIVAEQQTAVLGSEKEKMLFLEKNNQIDPAKSEGTPQSEVYFLESFAEQLGQIKATALSLALNGWMLLHGDISRHQAAKPDRMLGSRVDPKQAETTRFRDVNEIFSDMSRSAEVHQKSFRRRLQTASRRVSVHVPLVIDNSEASKNSSDIASEFVIRSSAASELQPIEIKPESNSKINRLLGCRFCSAATCFNQSDSTSIFTQCLFGPFNENSHELDSPGVQWMKLPSSNFALEPSLEISTGNEIRLFAGINRVKDDRSQFVCGVEVARFGEVFGLSISVCSRQNGTLLYQQAAPDAIGLSEVRADVELVNALWVRQQYGWTTGVGFTLTDYPLAKETAKVLNIELETVYQ